MFVTCTMLGLDVEFIRRISGLNHIAKQLPNLFVPNSMVNYGERPYCDQYIDEW